MAGPLDIGPGYRRAHRIRRRAEFLEVQQGATSRIRTASLLVLARPRTVPPDARAISPLAKPEDLRAPDVTLPTGPLPTRLGVVASRRIGNAVHRNRAKRLIREAFRRCRADLPTAIDLVIIANQAAPTRSLADIEREMSRVGRDLRRAFGRTPGGNRLAERSAPR